MTGTEFMALTQSDNSRIKGATCADIHADWVFVEKVTGTLKVIDGDWADHSWSIERMPGNNDYWAQFSTCMNDKNCDVGLSTWLNLTDNSTGETFRGDINAKVTNAVPEPSAALVFTLGGVVMSPAIRRRNR